jgi:hypothetical protein
MNSNHLPVSMALAEIVAASATGDEFGPVTRRMSTF